MNSDSPCIDRGKVIEGFTQSYQGKAPDMGAYEGDKLIEGPPFRIMIPPGGLLYKEKPRITRHRVKGNELILFFSWPLDPETISEDIFHIQADGMVVDVTNATLNNSNYEVKLNLSENVDGKMLALRMNPLPLGENGESATHWASTLALCEISPYSNLPGGNIMSEATQDVPAPRSEIAHRYLDAIKTFADNVLKHGRDIYGPKQTPLLVDGINVDTLEPPVWRYKGGEWVMSNLASQQNLFRTLVGLSEITGEPKYRQTVVDAVAYTFDNLQYPNGLLPWGGHAFYDALGEKVVGEGPRHELELHYPFYELLWQVNPEATKRFIEASWSAHVIEWERLDINRHGAFDKHLPGNPWSHKYRGGKVPFTGKGLSFIMAGTDLVRAAAWLSHLSGDEKPLIWAKHLAKRYVEARHPETGLGPANFTVVEEHRMEKQFPQFGGRFTEATVTDLYGDRYRNCAICQLRLGEVFGANAQEFLQWAIEDLTARANHGHDEQMNTFSATLIDGTELSPADIIHPGYVKQRWLEKRKADGEHFHAYALAYKLSEDNLMWRMTRAIGRGLGLGELGKVPGKPDSLNHQTRASDPLLIFGLLELYEATDEEAYLEFAVRLGDNTLESRFDKGFFVKSKNHIFAKFDDPTSLALLHLHTALLDLPTQPPKFWASKPYFHCGYDGKSRTYDNNVIYSQTRDED